MALLREAGVAIVEGAPAADEEAAVALARALGGPVALKVSSPAIRHKAEAGALELGVHGEEAVRAAHRRLAAAHEGTVLVERMAAPGVELIVAARRDAVVPALVLGLGGAFAELLDDVAIVPLPCAPPRAERALRELRGAGLLTGARGRDPVDLAAVAELAVAAGRALLDLDLALVELNPVICRSDGAIAVDAVVRRAAPRP
jgi:succinyl-CoA synthetase beta subunit